MSSKEEVKKVVPEGFFKQNTSEIVIDGRTVRVFTQELEAIKKGLSKLAKKK
jgi:hypothetical protein